MSKGANFYLKPIFWTYNTGYLVLCCEMIRKSMSLTMQFETYQVWAITNRLYIEMQGPVID